MAVASTKSVLVAGTSLALAILASGAAHAQATSGDLSGTPAPAGTGQSAAASTNAPAQGRAATDTGGGDIIVTARRVEERLQDVPISITVFNQQQVSNRNIVNSSDLSTYTPSLSANSNFGQENTSFAIRGFVQDPGTPPSVGVYFADVVALRGPTQGTQAGDTAGPGSFFDLQNVQVLKGPQGTLFGRNTTGGAILFVPQKPTSRNEGYVEGSYGNYDMYRLQGAINLALSDTARFRLSGDHLERDGWLHNTSGIGPKGYNDVDYTALRASLVVDLTPDLENYTIVSYLRSRTNGSVNKLVACNPTGVNPTSAAQIGLGVRNFIGLLSCGQLANEAATGRNGFYDVEAAVPNPKSRLTQWQAINTTTFKASDTLTLKNIVSYGQLTNFQRSPLFGTNWSTANLAPIYRSVFFLGAPAIFTGIFPAPNLRTADQYTFTDEMQAQGSALDDRLTYQAGAYFERSGPLGTVGNQSPQLIPCTDVATLQCTDVLGTAFTTATSASLGFTVPVQLGAVNRTVGRTNYRDVGVYAQATYTLTDQLKVTGGVRYTWDRQSNTSTRVSNSFPVFNFATGVPVLAAAGGARCTDPGTVPTCSESLRQKSDKPTWLIDLDYKPVDSILIYAKYARGYRAGGVFPNAPSDLRTFGPEKVDAYETGLKASFGGALRGTFNVAGFYNNFSDQQIQIGFDARVDPATGATAPVSPTTAPVNVGRSRIYGAEVEASISPFQGLVLDGSYTYLNATIRKIAPVTSADANYQVSFSPAPGSDLTLSPKHKLSATATYTLPLDESVGRVSVGATYSYVSSQITSYAYQNPAIVALFGNLGRLDSRNLLNVNLTWASVADAPVDVSLFATNVTKEKYYAYVPGLATSGSEYAALGEPRMYGARLRYRFGN